MGMSVVGGDYDQLKRYNLAELYSPTPKPQAPEKKESETTESKSWWSYVVQCVAMESLWSPMFESNVNVTGEMCIKRATTVSGT